MTDIFAKIAQLSPEQRKRLLQHLKHNATEQPLTLTRRESGAPPAPLSFAQERFWLLCQLDSHNASYNVHGALHLQGPLDIEILHRSLLQVIRRHDILRTNFPLREGQPVQVVSPHVQLSLPLIDLQALSPAEREPEALRLVFKHSFDMLDLVRDPLVRASVLRLGPQEHVFLFVAHHIIFDAWSVGVLVREVATIYDALKKGQPVSLPELPFQYADYAVWLRRTLTGKRLEKLAGYWREKLAGASMTIDLPFDYKRITAPSFQGARVAFLWPVQFREQLKRLGKQEHCTLFMILLAAFQLLLYRYTGQEDIVIGSPIAGRNRAEIEGMLGCFINTLVLRTNLAGNPTFRELLHQVRQTCLEAYEHQDFPIEKLADILPSVRRTSVNALFQVIFAFHNTSGTLPSFAGLTARSLENYDSSTNFDLGLECFECPEGLGGSFEYMVDVFEEATIVRFARHLRTLLEAVIANPDTRALEVPLLSDEERRQILLEWNATRREYPVCTGLSDLFERQSALTPDRVAVICGDEHLTYQELDRYANRLARFLQRHGVKPEVSVGLCMQRSLEMVVGLLGILKAGGAFIPLDPAYPPDRLEFMVEDSQITLLLTQAQLTDRFAGQPVECLCLDPGLELLAHEEDQAIKVQVDGQSLAYTIYTSGSTGWPKGAMNTQQGVCNRLLWMQEIYRLAADDRVLQKTPCSFDVSVWEFFWPLIAGARLIMARPGGQQDPLYLTQVISEQGITVIHFVPSMLQLFLDLTDPALCCSLRHVICSGETLPLSLQERCAQALAATVHNLYGPTEAAIDVTAWTCQPSAQHPLVPIGYPIANTQIYLLDSHYEPVPIGVTGELYIGGTGLARGYLHQPALTAASFVPHPWSAEPGARLYRTGDLARYRADGSIEFLGRRDQQVKIRGVRLELAEVEAILKQHKAVRQAVAVVRHGGGEQDERYLAAFVTLRAEYAKHHVEDDLRAFLRAKLPEVMIPSYIRVLEEMPSLPNGKLNRQALPALDLGQMESEADAAAPTGSTEHLLHAIWCQILGRQRISVHANFFDIGGTSLGAVRLLAQINERFQLNLPLQTIFSAPTIAECARTVERVFRVDNQNYLYSYKEIDFSREAELEDEISVHQPFNPALLLQRQVLLTGATGFIGAFLLRELLERTEARIFCLVRCSDPVAGQQRLRETLQSLLLWDEQLWSRVVVIPGDLAQPGLGLPVAEFTRLAEEIDMVYHCGAWVNALYPYHVLRATNVLGTREMLRLVSQGRPKLLHYISTLSVFSARQAAQELIVEDRRPNDVHGLADGYSQSKWVAEHMIYTARSKGLPVTIYRLGMTTGHSHTGVSNTEDMICRMLKGCFLLGSVPEAHFALSLTPVDYVVRAITYLAGRHDTCGANFHVYNPHVVDWNVISQWVRDAGYPLRLLPFQVWRQELLEAARTDPQGHLNALLSLLPGSQEVSLSGTAQQPAFGFDCRQTSERLASASILCPSINRQLIQKYIAYVLKVEQ